MSLQNQKDNQGVLFKNRHKKEDRHPDYRGTITVDGKQKTLAAWIRTSEAGRQYLSLSVEEIEKDEFLKATA